MAITAADAGVLASCCLATVAATELGATALEDSLEIAAWLCFQTGWSWRIVGVAMRVIQTFWKLSVRVDS